MDPFKKNDENNFFQIGEKDKNPFNIPDPSKKQSGNLIGPNHPSFEANFTNPFSKNNKPDKNFLPKFDPIGPPNKNTNFIKPNDDDKKEDDPMDLSYN